MIAQLELPAAVDTDVPVTREALRRYAESWRAKGGTHLALWLTTIASEEQYERMPLTMRRSEIEEHEDDVRADDAVRGLQGAADAGVESALLFV